MFGDFARTFTNDGRLFYLDGNGDIREFPVVGQTGLGRSLLGFGQDADGELYVLANGTGTPFGTTGVVLRLATLPGDGNADGNVDLVDYSALRGCITGPGTVLNAGCTHMDLNRDGSIDLADFRVFQESFTSP